MDLLKELFGVWSRDNSLFWRFNSDGTFATNELPGRNPTPLGNMAIGRWTYMDGKVFMFEQEKGQDTGNAISFKVMFTNPTSTGMYLQCDNTGQMIRYFKDQY